jgi:hypothetical protein
VPASGTYEEPAILGVIPQYRRSAILREVIDGTADKLGVQRAFVVRLEGIRSKTMSVMMEKKNPRISQPTA